MIFHIRILNYFYAKLFEIIYKNKFKNFGRRTRLVFPIAIESPGNISLGDDIYIAAQTCLATRPLSPYSPCTLRIGDGCKIGRFNHIYATGSIILHQNVLTANGVYISDNYHDYRDIQSPIVNQPVLQGGHVEIGEGTWIGHNACVLGVRIGRNCVIGANSVVTHDIPDYCVAVGAPAKIIKRYDPDSNTWRRADVLS
ncbi:DapH/DapD/GlmU-related protein [Limnohabitans sp. Bal53]|uniref:acyltransferase n=1 Tax=Limnohabitans sp. Bal53 TaxID=1977910 RepID=UPI000D347F54|nr:acyltransferase [Limnohabitans sp. Bal53]PUE42383.1 hypothetical protein B9Z50_00455 [Limnohabitans sp. Bal53]